MIGKICTENEKQIGNARFLWVFYWILLYIYLRAFTYFFFIPLIAFFKAHFFNTPQNWLLNIVFDELKVSYIFLRPHTHKLSNIAYRKKKYVSVLTTIAFGQLKELQWSVIYKFYYRTIKWTSRKQFRGRKYCFNFLSFNSVDSWKLNEPYAASHCFISIENFSLILADTINSGILFY